MGDVENMLERDKGRKIDEAEQLLNDLDDQIELSRFYRKISQ